MRLERPAIRSDRATRRAARNLESVAMRTVDLATAIGGAAGQGIATPGNILARILVRRGLHVNVYDAYQSIIRGGHIFLTLRTSDQPGPSHRAKLGRPIPPHQGHPGAHPNLF